MLRSAWTGTSSLANPKRDVALAKDLGLSGLYVMVNDHSRWRRPHRFCLGQTRSGQERKRQRVLDLANLCHESGIRFHLVSWVMPHEDYMRGARDVLVPLAIQTRAESLQWDGEEPWTRARTRWGRRMPVGDIKLAAVRLSSLFSCLTRPMGATGIGYAGGNGPFSALAHRCNYVVPQAYSFGMATAPAFFHRRYQQTFKREVRIGLRAYPQKLHPSRLNDQMRAHWASALETDAVEAIYWSLSHIRRRRLARMLLAELKAIDRMELG